jgi:hypothetical protein
MAKLPLAGLLVALFCSHDAAAQVIDLTPPTGDQMREGYEATRLSASTLVSAQLGAAASVPASRLGVIIPNPGDGVDGRHLCVNANSRDGLFWARHTYIPAEAAAAWRAPALSYQYTRELNGYSGEDLLVIARLGGDPSCSQDVVHLPIIFERNGSLFIDLNSRDRTVEASLTGPDGVRQLGHCRRITSPNLIADRACRFDLPEAIQGGLFSLELVLDDFPFDRAQERFTLFLPDRGTNR